MNKRQLPAVTIVAAILTVSIGLTLLAQKQDKYTLKVPGSGLAFSEFKGYESWQVVAISHAGERMAVTMGNPAAIKAYQSGIPANGKPFPDGAKLAKIHWLTKQMAAFPDTTVPAAQHDADFMVKDSKRFADSGGWGWAEFEYDPANDTFRPGTTADAPPQHDDAKCGYACHTGVKDRDFVFTDYGHR